VGGGEWSIALLGLFVLSSGALELLHGMRARATADATDRYIGALVAIIAGPLLFALPSLVLNAVRAGRIRAGALPAARPR
jgi:uncharacterized membrane protein HdeD (DUF308 family)